jgi:hypothetical protein
MNNEEFQIGVISPVECYKEGWELIKGQYWILFAISIVGMIIGGISMYILLGSMVCGMFYCFFQVIDGGKADLESLFKGFNYFKPSLLVIAVIVIPMIIVFSIIYIPVILTLTGSGMNEDEVFKFLTATIIVEFIAALIMVCFHTLLMFAFPLIVDRNLGGWQAIKTSAKAVWQNLSGVAGLWAVGFGIAMVGYLLLCVGIYFTIPIIIAGTAVAYRKVFPKESDMVYNSPPPPNAYQGTGNQN